MHYPKILYYSCCYIIYKLSFDNYVSNLQLCFVEFNPLKDIHAVTAARECYDD